MILIDKTAFFNLYNLIYFFTACLVLASALSSEIKKDIVLQNKLGQYLVFLPLIFLIFLVGFRGYDVGVDTISYFDILWGETTELNFEGEFLFDSIALVMRNKGLDFSYFLLLISFLFYIFIYKALKNFTDRFEANLLITFFACMSFFFYLNMSINVIRQGLSLSILMFVYSLWVNRKGSIIITIVLLLLTLTIHSSSIFPISLLFIAYFLVRMGFFNYIIFIYFISILLSYFNYGLSNFSTIFLDLFDDDRHGGYFTQDGSSYTVGFKPEFVIFNTFFLLVFLHVKNKLTDADLSYQYTILVSYYILSSIFYFMVFQLPYSDRWGMFSWCVIPLLISPMFYSSYFKETIKIHYVLMLILIYIGFYLYA